MASEIRQTLPPRAIFEPRRPSRNASHSQPRWPAEAAEAALGLPEGAWDSHMHVIDPEMYPLASDACYVPSRHLLGDALGFEAGLGFSNIVLVQPSIYGNDNSCMLDALRLLGPSRARAVVAFDPDEIDLATLSEWNSIGVRGVRINFQSIDRPIREKELVQTLERYAKVIRPFDWVLQLYLPLVAANILEKVVPKLNIKVCLDHYGSPSMTEELRKNNYNPYQLPSFSALELIIQGGKTYTKISAPYRFSGDEKMVERLTKELFQIRDGRRVVFATDWPHTRFTGLDIEPFAQRVLSWCDGDTLLAHRVFRDNARELWGVGRDPGQSLL